jgi:hypothetical protein
MHARTLTGLGVTALATTTLASTAWLAAPAGAASTLALHGTVAGSYTTSRPNPDVGAVYSITAHGHTSLGATRAAGTAHGLGNVASGHCTARLTLTTSKGKVTVAIRSTKTFRSFASCQSGFAFGWHVAKSSGSYAGDSGSGTGTLTLVKASNASHSPPPAYVTFD